MAQLHKHLYNEKTETVFLMADAKHAFVSSTMAKQVISLGGPGEDLVPPCVLKKNEREIEQVMEDTMKVLKLLEELEDIVDDATGLPLSNKIMVDAEEIFQIVREIRLALPDDVQQAKWIRDERDRILGEAKAEYERIIREAKNRLITLWKVMI